MRLIRIVIIIALASLRRVPQPRRRGIRSIRTTTTPSTDLLEPASHQFAIVYFLTERRVGATVVLNQTRSGSAGSDVAVFDPVTGEPLKFEDMTGAELTADGTTGRFDPQEHYIRAHLTRPVREGSEGRVRILKTYMDEKSSSRRATTSCSRDRSASRATPSSCRRTTTWCHRTSRRRSSRCRMGASRFRSSTTTAMPPTSRSGAQARRGRPLEPGRRRSELRFQQDDVRPGRAGEPSRVRDARVSGDAAGARSRRCGSSTATKLTGVAVTDVDTGEAVKLTGRRAPRSRRWRCQSPSRRRARGFG